MGFDVVRQTIEVKRLVGYLPEGAPLYGDMTVLAFLRFVADMRGLEGEDGKRRMDEAIGRTQLEEVAHRPIGTLSSLAGVEPAAAGLGNRRSKPSRQGELRPSEEAVIFR